jgi:hypothetical protein
MRKIEKQMLSAIHAKVDKWMNDNTAVFYISASESGNPNGSRSEIYLHGNLIAEYWHDAPQPLEVDTITLARWSTPTTKSRLRALGANVATRKGVTYLNNEAI